MLEHTFDNHISGESRTCIIKPLHLDQLDLLMDFQNIQFIKIQNKDTYKPFTREECSFLFENGFFEGVFWNGELVYFLGCLYPADDNLGIDLKLPLSQLSHVAHLEAGIARDDFRGFGIHQYMISHCLGILEQDGRTNYVCCTVSPFNLASLKPLLNAGMEIAMLKEKYGAMIRYILLKQLNHSTPTKHL